MARIGENKLKNKYQVGDKVEVIMIKRDYDPITKQIVVYEAPYAGTVLTYHQFETRNGETFWLYKVSVDGYGDIIVAREREDGYLFIERDVSILQGIH